MFVTVYGPFGHKQESGFIDTQGQKLGALLRNCGTVENVRIDGRQDPDWQNFVPEKGTSVEITAAAGTGFEWIPALIAMAISLVITGITYALTPKPKKPKLDSPQEAFGIAGFNNTTGRGTPAFVPYGLNRIFGHVISSGASLSPDGKQMYGRVLYMMGDTGGDAIESISDIEIDKTSISQIPEIVTHVRLGTDGQTVIPEFENDDDLFSDGRSIDFDPEALPGTPLIYTTKGTNINRATLFFNFFGGLYRINGKGKTRQAGVYYRIEYSPAGAGTWTAISEHSYYEQVKGGLFKTFEVNFHSAGQWDIRITAVGSQGFENGEPFFADALLFNVQETVFTNRRYPQWALLGLTNIPSKKIRSLEAMACSALVEGKRVNIPDGIGGSILRYTRERCWIVRDMMTHPIVGMGSEIDESEIDDLQWIESQGYYNALVTGHSGNEPRDLCDYVVNQSDWDWEHVKKVCGEGRGRIVPSGEGWKYVIDRPGTPNLLYAEGANIIDGSMTIEISRPDKPFSEITAQFRDVDKDYENNFSPPIVDPEAISPVQELLQYDTITRESEVQRENMIIFKRAFLERRRWSFASPTNAIVSEPMDLDYLAERGIGNEGSYSGFLPAGSTATIIILPDIVTLESGAGYALIVKHKGDNTTEYRTVSTGAGTWGQVLVSSPYIQAPAEGDIFSLGIENVEHIITRAAELEIDGEGRIRQVRSEYVPAIYTQDALPSKSARRRFALGDSRPPIPLRDAQVSEEVALNRDGSVRSILIFDVTPGLPINSGILRLNTGLPDRVAVAGTEPDFDDYYNTAKISIIAGTGVGGESKVIDYDGPNRVAFLSPNLPVVPDTSSTYTMEWERFADFGGFKVEMSEDTRNSDLITYPDGINFSNLAHSNDTHWEMDGRGTGPGLVYFRFTPISPSGTENAVARIVRSLLIEGDLSAPAPPTSVSISSYLLGVEVKVTMASPVAEDFSGVEIEYWRHAIGTGVLLETARYGASADSRAGSTMTVVASLNLGARVPPETYGTVIWARARSKDYSDNPKFGTPEYNSLAVNSPTGTTLTADPAAAGLGAGPPSIPTGLTLNTGVQVDPVDGVIKPFLDISWNLNPEPDMATYEVHYRRVGDTPVTAVMVNHPQIFIREIGVIGGVPYEARIQAIDAAGNRSGFSAWVGITTERDRQPPGPAVPFSILGGFKLISIFFTPPSDPDLAGTQIFISPPFINDLAQAFLWGEAPHKSVSFTATGLLTGTPYYIWTRPKDWSGNLGNFYPPDQFGGIFAQTISIGPNDLIVDNAVITNTAQIANAIINNGHIISLAADKLTAGTINALINIGVGDRIVLDAPSRLITVLDDNGIARVQMGRQGVGAASWGLNIFGSDGSLWHSFTGGTQTAGRQEVNEATFAVVHAGPNSDSDIFTGVFPISNTPTQIVVRVVSVWRRSADGKGGTDSAAGASTSTHTITHNIGKVMTMTCGLTSLVEPSPPITATVFVHYW